jgi:hypothetical protein
MTALVEVPKAFFRSVRVDHDLYEPVATQEYLITPQVRQVLQRLVTGLESESNERAWTLTGPYGGGKSAFVLYLSRLLGSPTKNNAAWAELKKLDSSLAERVQDVVAKQPLQPIALTLRRTSLARNILEGLRSWLERDSISHKKASTLRGEIEHNLGLEYLDTRRILGAIKTALEINQGMVLILDELGKALEFAAREPKEDIYLLQELAEFASRSQKYPFLLVGVLHQGFEEYTQALEVSARREWGKVQGRFADIAFLEPPAQQMWLASKALKSLKLPESPEYQAQLERIAQDVGSVTGLDETAFAGLAGAAYPLHPLVLLSLPHVFRRFAQNERSLFAYLASQEPFSPLERRQQRGAGLLRLPDVYDYLINTFGGQLAHHPTAKAWLEIGDVIAQNPQFSPLEMDVFKTIGLLNIIGHTSQLKATEAYVCLALRDQLFDAEIRGILEKYLQKGLLFFRLYTDTYRIFEGSSVDVEGQLEAGRHITAAQSLGSTLQKYLPQRPMVARKHSFEKGTLRFFEVHYLDAPQAVPEVQEGAQGLVLCCLPSTPAAANAFLAWAQTEEVMAQPNVVVAIPQQIGTLREFAHEFRALGWVLENTPELQQDRVAKREIDTRVVQVEQQVQRAVEELLNPESSPLGSSAVWYWHGELQPTQKMRDVMKLLSKVMDALFPKSMRLKNELVNRRALSSAAAGARNSLIKAMLETPHLPQLGIEGFPPERSMYESVLRATGLHRENLGTYRFTAPHPDSHLMAVWQELETQVFASLTEPKPLDALFEHMAAPPFGATQGVLPILVTALLQIYPNEVSLYREGTFLPEPSVADFEVLVRRPELFALAGGRVSGERVAVVTRFARSLGVDAATMPVVRALMKMVKTMPEHAWRTQKMPKEILQTRAVFERARSPERLLYAELPEALGQAPFADTGEAEPSRIEAFFTVLNQSLQAWARVYPDLLERSRDELLSSCDLPTGSEGWEVLRSQAKKIDGKMMHTSIAPVIKRLAASGEETASLESVLAQLASRPAKTWTDVEVVRFPAQAQAFAKHFLEAKHSHSVLSKPEAAESNKVYRQLKTDHKDVPSHILRAALAKLLQEL